MMHALKFAYSIACIVSYLSCAYCLGPDLLINWEAPSSIKSSFPYYLSGYDEEDRAILVLELGKWNTRKVVDAGGKDMDNLKTYFAQLIQRVGSDFFQKKNRNDNSSEAAAAGYSEIIPMMDYDGFDLSQMSSPSNIKFIIQNLSKFELYHRKVAFGFIVNANAVAKQLIFLLKPVLGAFFQRIDIYGTESRIWIPRILKRIPKDQLHPSYGGLTSFKPLAVYG